MLSEKPGISWWLGIQNSGFSFGENWDGKNEWWLPSSVFVLFESLGSFANLSLSLRVTIKKAALHMHQFNCDGHPKSNVLHYQISNTNSFEARGIIFFHIVFGVNQSSKVPLNVILGAKVFLGANLPPKEILYIGFNFAFYAIKMGSRDTNGAISSDLYRELVCDIETWVF